MCDCFIHVFHISRTKAPSFITETAGQHQGKFAATMSMLGDGLARRNLEQPDLAVINRRNKTLLSTTTDGFPRNSL